MKNEVATKTDLDILKHELLDKLVDKEQHQKDMATLATKEELNQAVAKLATKEELNQAVAKLATKDELRQAVAKLATKEELKQAVAKLATKEELKWEINELRREIKQIDERHNQRYEKILVTLDGIAGLLQNGRVEKAATEATFQRHKRTLDDHEHRIEQLELQHA
ncbi:hypothetical protein L0Z72_15380 [candidate division KSB1 bacterium]|nr:hypothetical protein [candidate division KSB1 bacterium]